MDAEDDGTALGTKAAWLATESWTTSSTSIVSSSLASSLSLASSTSSFSSSSSSGPSPVPSALLPAMAPSSPPAGSKHATGTPLLGDAERTAALLMHGMRAAHVYRRTQHILGVPYSDLAQLYEVGERVGDGVAGVVRACTDLRTREVFACKTLEKAAMASSAHLHSVRTEVRALRAAGGHDSVVTLRDVHEDDKRVHIIMELCEGGDLFDRIKQRKRFPESDAAHVCRTLLSVLKYCHAKGIMHRDVKPENVLMMSKESNTEVKLVDFGQAEFFTPGKKMTKPVGSKYYVAPEVLDCSYGPEADVWSLGVSLYILLSGSPPFNGKTNKELFRKVRAGVIDLEHGPWRKVSSKAKSLVRRMLCTDPRKRITTTEALSHPWILQQCGPDNTHQPQELNTTESNTIYASASRLFPCKTAPISAPGSPMQISKPIVKANTLRGPTNYSRLRSYELHFHSSPKSSNSPNFSPSPSTRSSTRKPKSPSWSKLSQNPEPRPEKPSRNRRFRLPFTCNLRIIPRSWTRKALKSRADSMSFAKYGRSVSRCTFRLSSSEQLNETSHGGWMQMDESRFPSPAHHGYHTRKA